MGMLVDRCCAYNDFLSYSRILNEREMSMALTAALGNSQENTLLSTKKVLYF